MLFAILVNTFSQKEKAVHPKADGLSSYSLKLAAAIRHGADAHQVDFDCQRIDDFIQGINSHCGNRDEQYDGGFDNFHKLGQGDPRLQSWEELPVHILSIR